MSNQSLSELTTLTAILKERAIRTPRKIAYTFLRDGENDEVSINYQHLHHRALLLANYFLNSKLKGERVIIGLPSGLEFIETFLGCLYAGVIAVPAYPPVNTNTIKKLESIIKDSNASLMITSSQIARNIRTTADTKSPLHTIKSVDVAHCYKDTQSPVNYPRINKTDIAFLQYTSGSTSTPKGVIVTHQNIMANEKMIGTAFNHAPEKIGVGWLPLFHDMGLIGNILYALYCGERYVFMSPIAFLQKPVRWLNALTKYKGYASCAPNFAYDLCVQKVTPKQKQKLNLSHWKIAASGSEPVQYETIKTFSNYFKSCGFNRKSFFPCFGMAETTLFVSGHQKARQVIDRVDPQALKENKIKRVATGSPHKIIVGCGHTSVGDQVVKIVNPQTLEECRTDEVGEVWVSGSHITKGYWMNPETTKKHYDASINGDKRLYFRTGDLGYENNQKELFITGRIKDLIIVRGQNIYPQDIEGIAEKSHEAIRENCSAAFITSNNQIEKLIIVAEIERRYIEKQNYSDIYAAIRDAVSIECQLFIDQILLVKTGSIAKTTSGKIQRSSCKDAFENKTLEVIATSLDAAVKSSTTNTMTHKDEVEDYVTGLVQKALNRSITSEDMTKPFNEFGLDSLKIVEFAAEIESKYSINFSPTDLFNYPNLTALLMYLDQKLNHAPSQASPNLTVDSIHISTDIAVVGMACRFPNIESPEAFWDVLCNEKNTIRKTPKNRWDNESYLNHPTHPISSPYGGFLDNIETFDNQFFKISPMESKSMDPQHRLLLEVSWEAIESAGEASGIRGSNTGVYIGASNFDFAKTQFTNSAEVEPHSITGSAHSILANRLSYCLDLSGPNLCVDTACSSSLVAIHLAKKSLQDKECDQAIAGGVNIILEPEVSIALSKGKFLAPDGQCKPFDGNANGYVRSEGCGVVILKRLEDAKRDGNTIFAVIKGSAMNQDGRSNGLTAPNGKSQEKVIEQALRNAQLKPNDIDLIETHGTGTALGDPIEVESIKHIFQNNDSLFLGAVKANIGHLEPAAGIASFIKTVLCTYHRAIPKQINIESLNPLINLNSTQIKIPDQLITREKDSLFSGVSSFGFGGTNAHIIIGSHNHDQSPPISKRTIFPLFVSSLSNTGLKENMERYQSFLSTHSHHPLSSVAYSSWHSKEHYPKRHTLIGQSYDDFISQIADHSVTNKSAKSCKDQLAFAFTGQGTEYNEMGKELYKSEPIFKQAFDECDKWTQTHANISLKSTVFSKESNIHQSQLAQLSIFTIEYALAKLLESYGVKPKVLIGHSIGEYAAACMAGVFNVENAIQIICKRAELMDQIEKTGCMIAILESLECIKKELDIAEANISIAATNSQRNTVISGDRTACYAAVQILKKKKIRYIELQTENGFHSYLMDPILNEFKTFLESFSFQSPSTPIVSCLTGKNVLSEPLTATYWVDHLRSEVKFYDGCNSLSKHTISCVIEIGPNKVLSPLIKQNLGPHILTANPLIKNESGDRTFLQTLATLHDANIKINWKEFFKQSETVKVPLPPYSFAKNEYPIPNQKNGGLNVNQQQTPEFRHELISVLQKQIEAQTSQIKLIETLAGNTKSTPSAPEKNEQIHTPSQGTDQSIEYISAEVKHIISDVSGFPIHEIELSMSFEDLGFDSLMIVDLYQHIVKIYPAISESIKLFFNKNKTINEFVIFISNNRQGAPDITAPEIAPPLPIAIESNNTISPAASFEESEEFQALSYQLAAVKTLFKTPYFRMKEKVNPHTEVFENREMINYSSYNYLGLSGNSEVNLAACEAIETYGTSVSASRILSGEIPIHKELESQLASFIGTEDALAFVSGHATNVTTLGHLIQPDDLILFDELSHNSIIQGCIMSKATRQTFPHNNWQALESKIKKLRPYYKRVFIIIEGVYSMDGDIANLKKCVEIKKKYNAFLYVDEAHSIGVIGQSGKGITEHWGVDPNDIDLMMGTLSKSLASCGGFITGKKTMIDYLRYTVPGFIFSAGISPANAAASLAAVKTLRNTPSLVTELHRKSNLFLTLAKEAELNVGVSDGSPIIPIILGSSELSIRLSKALFDDGINVDAIVYPAVDEHLARLRFFISTRHTDDQIRQTVQIIQREITKIVPVKEMVNV